MAIPSVSDVSNAGAGAGETPQRKSSSAAHDRRVKLQHFLVMKAFNLRKEKQTVSQQFQFLKKHDDNQVMPCLLFVCLSMKSCVCQWVC